MHVDNVPSRSTQSLNIPHHFHSALSYVSNNIISKLNCLHSHKLFLIRKLTKHQEHFDNINIKNPSTYHNCQKLINESCNDPNTEYIIKCEIWAFNRLIPIT